MFWSVLCINCMCVCIQVEIKFIQTLARGNNLKTQLLVQLIHDRYNQYLCWRSRRCVWWIDALLFKELIIVFSLNPDERFPNSYWGVTIQSVEMYVISSSSRSSSSCSTSSIVVFILFSHIYYLSLCFWIYVVSVIQNVFNLIISIWIQSGLFIRI